MIGFKHKSRREMRRLSKKRKWRLQWTQTLREFLEKVLAFQVSATGWVVFLIIVLMFFTIVSKGISSNLMKISAKRRRSRVQIEEEKRDEDIRKQQT